MENEIDGVANRTIQVVGGVLLSTSPNCMSPVCIPTVTVLATNDADRSQPVENDRQHVYKRSGAALRGHVR